MFLQSAVACFSAPTLAMSLPLVAPGPVDLMPSLWPPKTLNSCAFSSLEVHIIKNKNPNLKMRLMKLKQQRNNLCILKQKILSDIKIVAEENQTPCF